MRVPDELPKLDNIIPKTKRWEGQGHWRSKKAMDPDKYFGFLYFIHNLQNGMYYLGCKQYKSWGRKTRNRNYGKEMNWRAYTGSCKELNATIRQQHHDYFWFVVIRECKTRGGLFYQEANLQHKLDVLTKRKGDKRLFYNGNIRAVKFIPKEY
jgi:hypothetical protein